MTWLLNEMSIRRKETMMAHEEVKQDHRVVRGRRKRLLLLFLPFSALLVVQACGGGWDAYKEFYENQDPGDVGEPWEGPESVFLVLGETEVESFLEGIVTTAFPSSSGVDIPGVLLSEFIEGAGMTASPESFRYDFTATDGYNLLIKRYGDPDLLPDWSTMQHGFLYLNEFESLTVGWDPAYQPWGSALSAYNVKYMDGGTITLIEP